MKRSRRRGPAGDKEQAPAEKDDLTAKDEQIDVLLVDAQLVIGSLRDEVARASAKLRIAVEGENDAG